MILDFVMMAAEDKSQVLDTQHEEKDWEAQKENFRRCYIDDNRTKEKAAQYMKDHFNFDATPRQWERKIKQWGFTKYSSRDERLRQIEQAGKSIFDISRPGRRSRSRTDERGGLLAPEDRNLRRFARREVSRSRSRSRSQSFTGGSYSHINDEHPPGPSNAVTDQTYNLKLSSPALQHPPSNGGFNIAATPASGEQDEPIQLHYLREEKSTASGEEMEPDLLLTVHDGGGWPQASLPDLSHQFDLTDGQDQYQAYSDTLLLTQGLVGNNLHEDLQYPHVGNNPSFDYLSNQTMSTSTGFGQVPLSGNSMEINPDACSDDILSDQQMFGPVAPLQETPNALGSTDLVNLPIITFDGVDVDSTRMLSSTEATPFPDMPNIPHMPEALTDLSITENGPLHTDVMPLVEEYTRAVQTAVLWCLGGQQYNHQLGDSLAASLEQPGTAALPCAGVDAMLTPSALGQVFKARMAVVLDNFAKSQQRAFQSMRDTCSKLRQKNAVLEAIVKEGQFRTVLLAQLLTDTCYIASPANSGQFSGNGVHRSSLPLQPSLYHSSYSTSY